MAGIASRRGATFRPIAYTAGMPLEKVFAVALVAGVIGPLFWLGVNVAEGKLKRLLREKIAQRKARRAAADGGRRARLCQ